MKTIWLDRTLSRCARHYCICYSEKQFQRELTKLHVPPNQWPDFLGPNADGTVHYLDNLDKGANVAILCIDGEECVDRPINVVHALLTHEATHVWQDHLEEIGGEGSNEEEAYAIQNIAQNFMDDYDKFRLKFLAKRDEGKWCWPTSETQGAKTSAKGRGHRNASAWAIRSSGNKGRTRIQRN